MNQLSHAYKSTTLKNLSLTACLAVTSITLVGCNNDDKKTTVVTPSTPNIATNTNLTMAILETSDLHNNVMSYDYYKLAEDKSVGLERTATLINNARNEFANTVLLDNGDTIQGSALGDYQAQINPVKCDETLGIYKVMNELKFDAGTIGNHEFNYGLNYLNQITGSQFNVDGLTGSPSACKGVNFPLVLSNVYSSRTKQPLFKPYQIITKNFTATTPDGKTVTVPLKVGVIGFTTPGIMMWDKKWLDGKVYTEGAKEMAEKYVPEMRANGADIVVALSHGGVDTSDYRPTMENASFHLSKVVGIDAILMGHTHQLFPDANSKDSQLNTAGVDKVNGLLNNVPAVMPSFWGKGLGVIKLNLTFDGQKWVVNKPNTKVEVRTIQNPDKTFVPVDPKIAQLVANEHQATINYVKTPIGTSDFDMTSYFADVGDVSAIQVVNQAQAKYISDYIQANLPQYKDIPVLSVSAPFKSGFAGGSDYTDVKKGNIAINNAADLYLFPNTVNAVKVKGSQIKAWLETSAKRFNQINPSLTTPQALISTFPGYNFDMFTSPEIRYEIDVTKPVGSRIQNLTYQGKAIDDSAEFIIATNNYRASGGGGFPGLDGSNIIYSSPDANRDVLINYIKAVKNLTLTTNGSSRSWQFVKVNTAGAVTFKSASGKIGVAQQAGLNNISVINNDDGNNKGLADYRIDLSK